MIESETDSPRVNSLLELFLMGILSEQELEADLASPEEPENWGWIEVSSQR